MAIEDHEKLTHEVHNLVETLAETNEILRSVAQNTRFITDHRESLTELKDELSLRLEVITVKLEHIIQKP